MRKFDLIVLASLIALLIVPLSSKPAAAQDDWWLGLEYQVSIPLNETADFTGKTSFRGVGVEIRKITSEHVSIGGYFGWQVFNDDGVSQTTIEQLTVTGGTFRYINVFPLMVNAHYYLGNPGGLRLFGGLNGGAYVVERRVEVNLYAINDNQWQFGFAPELGIAKRMGWSTTGFINAKYNYGFEAGGNDAISYLSFGVGLAWLQL